MAPNPTGVIGTIRRIHMDHLSAHIPPWGNQIGAFACFRTITQLLALLDPYWSLWIPIGPWWIPIGLWVVAVSIVGLSF